MKKRSMLFKTPFRRRFGDCADNPPLYSIYENCYVKCVARLFIRVNIGDTRDLRGVGRLRIGSLLMVLWAWDIESEVSYFDVCDLRNHFWEGR